MWAKVQSFFAHSRCVYRYKKNKEIISIIFSFFYTLVGKNESTFAPTHTTANHLRRMAFAIVTVMILPVWAKWAEFCIHQALC